VVSGAQRIEQVGGLAYRLHHDTYGSLLRIGILDGERDALAFFVDAHYDELSGFLFARNARRLDDEPLDTRGKKFGV
jgi:hypothetical protein